MKYVYFRYQLEDEDRNRISPDKQWDIFHGAIWKDEYGNFSEYRGKRNTVLMNLRKYRSDFIGLIGRHSTEREVKNYNEDEDVAVQRITDDNDYPNTPFVCMPRLGIIAFVDGGVISANSAASRLHAILAHRKRCLFVVESIRESQDLRKAVGRFRVVEVTFEILPVNPHTGPLGAELDRDRALDHIKKLKGKAEGTETEPLQLEGGFLTQVQQLQQSGHAKAGYRAIAEHGIQISVSKPDQSMQFDEDEENIVHGESVDVKVEFPDIRTSSFPFDQGHVTQVRTIARRLIEDDEQ